MNHRQGRSNLFEKDLIKFHVLLVVVVGSCLALGWWQLNRALSGNELSWLYTFEWPFFAGYACFIWYKIIQSRNQEKDLQLSISNSSSERSAQRFYDQIDDSDDPELAEYNKYLKWLQENSHKAS